MSEKSRAEMLDAMLSRIAFLQRDPDFERLPIPYDFETIFDVLHKHIPKEEGEKKLSRAERRLLEKLEKKMKKKHQKVPDKRIDDDLAEIPEMEPGAAPSTEEIVRLMEKMNPGVLDRANVGREQFEAVRERLQKEIEENKAREIEEAKRGDAIAKLFKERHEHILKAVKEDSKYLDEERLIRMDRRLTTTEMEAKLLDLQDSIYPKYENLPAAVAIMERIRELKESGIRE